MTEITRLEHETREGQAPHGVEKITSHYCDLGEQWVAFAPHLSRLSLQIEIRHLHHGVSCDGKDTQIYA
jgi:hypothetical protein